MSQIYKASASGNPAIPTSFQTDAQDTSTLALTAAGGTAVPQGNILRIGGDNGIKTYEITQEAGSLTVGFIRGEGQTVGAVSTDIITQLTNTNSTMTIQIIAAGYADNNESIGIYGTAVVRNVSDTVTVVNTVDLIKNSDASLAGASLSVSGSGSSFVVTVTGVAIRTINWSVTLPGIVST